MKEREPAGCLSALFSLILMFLVAAPLLPLVVSYWTEVACGYGIKVACVAALQMRRDE